MKTYITYNNKVITITSDSFTLTLTPALTLTVNRTDITIFLDGAVIAKTASGLVSGSNYIDIDLLTQVVGSDISTGTNTFTPTDPIPNYIAS